MTGRSTPPFAPRRGLSAILLSFNEEKNIETAVKSVQKISDDVWVVDSGSTDRTVELARALGANVVHHAWPGFAAQWNWGLETLPFRHEYVLIRACDESLPDDWCRELREILERPEPPDLILTRWRFWWMGRPVQYGNYGRTYMVTAGRRSFLRYEDRECNEHIPLRGTTHHMVERYDHYDAKDLSRWFQKHIQYAQLEARERLKAEKSGPASSASLWGQGQSGRVRWLREQVYDRIPGMLRPWAYFTYRYMLGRGWRDGATGTWFHFMHGLWFPMLIDVFEHELRQSASSTAARPARADGSPIDD